MTTNIRDYCRQKNISTSRLSELTGIPYSTVNDIVNGKTDINNVRYGHVKSIARALSLSVDELEDLFVSKAAPATDYTVVVRNKCYYIEFAGRKTYLCKINSQSSYYIDEIARWQYEKFKQEEVLREWTE